MIVEVNRTLSFEQTAESLIGTSTTPEHVQELLEDPAFCSVLDNIAFRCSCCDWWCAIDEEESEIYGLDEWTCSQCCEEGV